MNIVSPDVDTGSYIDSVNISIDNIKEQILHFYYSLIRTNNVESQLLLNNLLSFLFTYLNISNGTPEGRLGRDSRTTFVPLRENELKGNPPKEDCPISNVHRCKGAYERPEKYISKNKTRKVKKNYFFHFHQKNN